MCIARSCDHRRSGATLPSFPRMNSGRFLRAGYAAADELDRLDPGDHRPVGSALYRQPFFDITIANRSGAAEAGKKARTRTTTTTVRRGNSAFLQQHHPLVLRESEI
jgi:hypothetical protein